MVIMSITYSSHAKILNILNEKTTLILNCQFCYPHSRLTNANNCGADGKANLAMSKAGTLADGL